MTRITQEEIDRTFETFENFTEADIQKFMRFFQKKQEPLLVYLAAVVEREELNDDEYDVLITMVFLAWEVIRRRSRKLRKISMKELDRMDQALFESLENDPDSLQVRVENHAQPVLLGTILSHVMDAEAEVREEMKGPIYYTLKNILDAMIQASDES